MRETLVIENDLWNPLLLGPPKEERQRHADWREREHWGLWPVHRARRGVLLALLCVPKTFSAAPKNGVGNHNANLLLFFFK